MDKLFSKIKSASNTCLYRGAGGYSFLELMISLAIFTMLSMAFLTSYNGFNKRVNLDALAHQMGQWVRDAQVSSMSVRYSPSPMNHHPGYGIHFAMAEPTKFVFFADLDGNYLYKPLINAEKCGDMNVECVSEMTLSKGYLIQSLCSNGVGAGAGNCLLASNPNPSTFFDIAFRRPNPDAVIKGDVGGVPTDFSDALITVVAPNGYKRSIDVWVTGQISVR